MTTTSLMPLGGLMNSWLYPSRSWRPVQREWAQTPRTRIQEGESDYIIDLDLPGVNKDDLNIEIENQQLSISASRNMEPAEGYKTLRSELAETVEFRRSFQLGLEINVDDVKADFRDGVLTIRLPKSEKAMPRRIEIK